MEQQSSHLSCRVHFQFSLARRVIPALYVEIINKVAPQKLKLENKDGWQSAFVPLSV
jgi:hypothetical protein